MRGGEVAKTTGGEPSEVSKHWCCDKFKAKKKRSRRFHVSRVREELLCFGFSVFFFFHVAAKQHVFGCTYSCSCRKVASNGRGRAYVRHRREKMKRVLVKRYKNPERTSTNKWLRTTVKEVIFIYVYVLRTYIYTQLHSCIFTLVTDVPSFVKI